MFDFLQLPTLKVGSDSISGTKTIILYLASHEPKLLGLTNIERAEVDQWLSFSNALKISWQAKNRKSTKDFASVCFSFSFLAFLLLSSFFSSSSSKPMLCLAGSERDLAAPRVLCCPLHHRRRSGPVHQPLLLCGLVSPVPVTLCPK